MRDSHIQGHAGSKSRFDVERFKGNEYKTAERFKKDYWLYVVFHCASTPEVHPIQDPARLGWEPVVKIEHYQVGAEKILGVER